MLEVIGTAEVEVDLVAGGGKWRSNSIQLLHNQRKQGATCLKGGKSSVNG